MRRSSDAVAVSGVAALAVGAVVLTGCSGSAGLSTGSGGSEVGAASPRGPELSGSGKRIVRMNADWTPRAIHGDRDDLTTPGDPSIRRVAGSVLETGRFDRAITRAEPLSAELLTGGKVKGGVVPGPRGLEVGEGRRSAADRSDPTPDSVGAPNASLGRGFFAIDQTPWNPPDPTLAVGPNHVLVTVNQSVAWYDRSGTPQFQRQLNTTPGTPGFFDEVGARSFTFDPKCFYDQYADRFVIVALEVYGTGTPETTDDEAAVTFAISDDDDPNGVWFKYRTDAITIVNGEEYWWDYPGFGYDEDNIYITGNLFSFGLSGGVGIGIRVIDKASILSGGPALVSTARNPSVLSAQSAQTFGSYGSAYFVSLATLDSLTVTAVTDPFGSFTITNSAAPIEPAVSPGPANVPGIGSIWSIALRTMNVHLDDAGRLLTGVAVGDPETGLNAARWYDIDLNGFPGIGGGQPTVVQSGQLTGGANADTYFPALHRNDAGEIGMVFAASSDTENISMRVTGWRPGDAPGTAGEPVEVVRGDTDEDGRWGDYYDLTVDPNDGTTFWAIGQIRSSFGWRTYVQPFTLDEPVQLASPIGGETLTRDQPTTVTWTGPAGGVYQVQQTDDFGASSQGFAENFNGDKGFGLAFSTSAGDRPWEIAAGAGPDGSDAAVSAPGLLDNETSILTLSVLGPGTISFDYDVSSEAVFDEFLTLVNGSAVVQDSGVPGWRSASAPLALGVNTVEFRYAKDVTVSQGLDRVAVDNIAVTTENTVWNDIVAQTAPGATSAAWTPTVETTTGAVRVRRLQTAGGPGPWDTGGLFTVGAGPPACPGDTNGDGAVDITDFFALGANFGTQAGATLADGDFDGDGDVDVSDFFVLASNFGSSCP